MVDRRALANTSPGQILQLPVADRYLGSGLIGTTVAGGELELAGSNDGLDNGVVHITSPCTIDVGSNIANEPNTLQLTGDFTATAPYVGGSIIDEGTVDVATAVFVYNVVQSTRVFDQMAATALSSLVLFNATCSLEGNAGFNTLPPLVFFNGSICRPANGAGAIPDTPFHVTVASFPNARAQSAFDSIRIIDTEGVRFGPTFNTNNFFASVNLGTCRGLHGLNPATVLFGQALGTEIMDAYYCVDVDNITFDTAKERAALRSAITDAVTHFCILNNGGARSNWGGGNHFNLGFTQHLGDGPGFSSSYGAGGGDTTEYFDGTRHILNPIVGNEYRWDFATNAGGTIISSDSATQVLYNGHQRYTFGQTSLIGNQIGIFAAPAFTVPIAGEFIDWLWSQAGSLDLNGLAMSLIDAARFNPRSITLNGGSLTEVSTINVNGMTTAGLGGAETQATRITGRARQRGVMQYEPILGAQITANQTAYTGWGTGNSQREWLIVDSDMAGRLIQGIDSTAVQDGDKRTFTNDGAFGIGFTDQDAAAAAADRIITGTGATVTVAADNSIQLRYDGLATRWRIIH